jgi:PAS domain S-box-containing protein
LSARSPWSSGTFRSTLSAALLGIGGAFALIVAALVEERGSRIDAATAQAENTSRLVASYVLQVVEKTDMVMRDVTDHLPPGDLRAKPGQFPRRTEELQRLMAWKLAEVPEGSALHVANADGDIVYSTVSPVPPVNLADRAHFVRHRNDPSAGLSISAPLISRTTGKWSFVVSRRLDFEDGSFAGIVNLVVNLDGLEKFFATVNVMERGVVNLRDRELRLMARFPAAPADIGKPVPDHPARAFLSQGLDHAVYSAPGSVDAVNRLYSFRAVRDLGLYVFVGLAPEDYLSDWRLHVRVYGLSGLVLSVAVLLMVVLAWRGVLEQQRAQLALGQEEEKLHRAYAYNRSLIEASLDPLVTIGPDGKITDVNAATEAVTGCSRGHLIGTEFSDYFSDPERARAGYQQVFREGRVHDYELEIRHLDGRLTPVLYNAAVYRDEAGSIIGVFAAARNIAERKRAEEDVHRLNAELESRVALRTAELEATNKELEGFSYSVSHDMRAPLRAIDGFSRILVDDHGDALGADGKRLLEAVRGNAQQMGQLIDDILHFLRTRKRKMAPGPVDIGALAREAFAELTAADPPARPARLEAGNLPPTWGDRDMLNEVVRNLVSNALKFSSPTRDLVVEIGGVAGPEENAYYVKDNGIGFDMQYADKLFKVFERVHQTGQYKGTAIGLALVKRIVERHGGHVRAEGQVDAGASFHFSLPNPKQLPHEGETT